MSNEIATQKNEIVFNAGGSEVKLSPSIVQQFVTRGNGKITPQEAFNFIQLCRYSELNPFLNEAYLVKFGNQPAQMITAKEALLKRASRQPDYKGMTSGLVVVTKDGNVNHKKGQMLYPNEELLGAWAQVIRAKFTEPIYVEVSFSEFNKGQSTWKQMPANMINKVAQAKALREAYPEQLGAMYLEEEPTFNDVTPTDNNGDPLTFEHNQPIFEEETLDIKDKIKELRTEVKELSKVKTLKEVDEMVADNQGVDDIKKLNEFSILTALIEIKRKYEAELDARSNE